MGRKGSAWFRFFCVRWHSRRLYTPEMYFVCLSVYTMTRSLYGRVISLWLRVLVQIYYDIFGGQHLHCNLHVLHRDLTGLGKPSPSLIDNSRIY